MRREIKFRGKRIDTGEWVYGGGIAYVGDDYCAIPQTKDVTSTDYRITLCKVVLGTEGQFTGLLDKNGTKIYEGDILRWYSLDIEYQTHTGDNIPNGSYTEPCGTICRKYEKPVIFRDAMFTCDPPHDPEEEEYPTCGFPIRYPNVYDRRELNQIFYPRPYGREHEVLTDDEFLEAAQSVGEELGFECASIDAFIQNINGFEVIGNIFSNPELLIP